VTAQRHASAALYPRERSGTYCTGGLVGSIAGLDRCGKLASTGIRSSARPALSQSLYRLRYPAHSLYLGQNTILYLGMCSVHDSACMVMLPSFYSVVTEPYGLAEFGSIFNSRNFLQHYFSCHGLSPVACCYCAVTLQEWIIFRYFGARPGMEFLLPRGI